MKTPIPRAYTLGNAWNVQQDKEGCLRYISDQWGGRVFGFEERDRTTLAQSDEVAIGIVAIGGGSTGVTRPIAERYPYHLRNEKLEVDEADLSAEAQAVTWLMCEDSRHRALPSIIAFSEPCASLVEADVLPDAPIRRRLSKRIKTAVKSLKPWNKRLYVDRISISLLEGERNVSETVADFHYAAIANGIRLEVCEATGQTGLPDIIVSQGAGTRQNGSDETILAEGRLNWNHFALGMIVATPKYPFEMMDDVPGTLTGDSALLVSELESRALMAHHDGKEWYCPSLEEAHLDGKQIVVRFATLSDLVLESDKPHGFTVNHGTIEKIQTNGNYVIIKLTEALDLNKTPLELRYAWGMTSDKLDTYSANRGALRDSWKDTSHSLPERTLYRYALSGRVTVRPKSENV